MMDFDDFISKLDLHDMSYLNEMPRIECAVSVQERVKNKAVREREIRLKFRKDLDEEVAEYELGEDLRLNIKHEGEHEFLMMERKWFGFGGVKGYRRVMMDEKDGCMMKMWKSLMCCMKK